MLGSVSFSIVILIMSLAVLYLARYLQPPMAM